MPISTSNKAPQQGLKPSPFFHPSTPARYREAVEVEESTPVPKKRHVEEAKSNLMGCTANLINAIVGSGIVGIPYAVHQAGLMAGIVLIGVCAVLTDKSLRLLVATAKHAHTASYERVAEAGFGKAGFRFIAISMFVMAYGACLSYLMIVKDSFSMLLGIAPTDFPRKRAVLWVLSVVVLMPLASQRDMANLAWTSRLSVLLDTILVALVAYNAFVDHQGNESSFWQTVWTDPWFRPETIFVGLGVLSFAFVCQHSAFLIAGSLERPTIQRWSWVTRTALILCATLAWTSGLAGYLGYGDAVQGNVLNNLPPHEWTANVARALLGCTMLFVYPLESFVARHVCVALLFQGRRAHEGNDDSDLLARSDRRVGLTTALFLLAAVPASLFENLGNVLAVTGAIGGSCLSYIGPGMVYMGIHGERFLELLAESWLLGSVARAKQEEHRRRRQQQQQQQQQATKQSLAVVETTPLVVEKDSAAQQPNVTTSGGTCQVVVQTFLWYALGMPLWCAMAYYGKVSLNQHMHDMALKSPHPLRIGDVEYKRVPIARNHADNDTEMNRRRFVIQRENSLPMNISAGMSIDQQIGHHLRAQKQRPEPLEPDPQENPTWYDFIVAIAFCIFGVVALFAGLLSLAVEKE